MLFSMTKDQVTDKYKELITSVWEKTNTIMMVDTDTRIGRFPMSDIILSYDTEDNLAIECERAYKKYYSKNDWAIMSFRAMTEAQDSENAQGIVTACTYSADYIDYIKYKKEWLDWADEIVRYQRPC